MSHHSNELNLENMSSFFKEIKTHQEEVAGKFPDGKLSKEDEGAVSMGISSMGDKVILAFGEPTSWVGLTPDQAAEFGALMIKRAREAGLKRPITIEI